MVGARTGLLILVLALAGTRMAAQPPDAQQTIGRAPMGGATQTQREASERVPTIQVTSRIVMLDVVVTDGQGHSVKGLKASDFALSEDGVPQKLDSFAEVDAAPEQGANETPLPPDTFTVTPPERGTGATTVIVLASNTVFVRDQLKQFVATSPVDMPIAIFRIDCIGLHLVQEFTADRKVLMEAANSKRIMPGWPPPDCMARHVQAIGAPAQRLSSYLAGVPGRINVVWFGPNPSYDLTGGLFEDLNSGVSPDLGEMLQNTGDRPGVHRLSRVVVYPIAAGGLVAPNACLSQACVENYARLISGGMAGCQQMMEAATKGGGKAFCDTNDFKSALAEVQATGSHYYTLSYRPSNPNWNGKYRRIKIDVPSLEQETVGDKVVDWFMQVPASLYPKVVYRDGYFAQDTPARAQTTPVSEPPPGGAAAPQRKLISISPKGIPPGGGTEGSGRMEAAMTFAKPTPTQVHFTVVVTPEPQVEKTKAGTPLPAENFLTGPFVGLAYRSYKIHYWVDPQDLHFERTAKGTYRDDFLFAAVIYRDDGIAVNSIASNSAHIEVSEDDRDLLLSSGATFDQTIAIPVDESQGRYFLRAGVREAGLDRVGSLEVPTEWVKPAAPPDDAVARTH